MFNRRPAKGPRRGPGWIWGILLVNAVFSPLVEGGMTNEGSLTVFRSDTNDSLLTLSVPFDIPASNAAPRLEFDFGFATDEPPAAGTFFDSFSVTLQNNDKSATALLLTADRTGVEWTPLNPGGLTITPADIAYAATNFPAVSPAMGLRYAYTVSFLLPPELVGIATLFVDFFNNLNQFASLAFVSNVRIDTGVAVPPSVLVLQSSAAAAGPFADETGVAVDTANKVMTLPQFGTARFFRLRSDLRALISRLRIEGGQLVFEYAFQPNFLLLQSAQQVDGPYVDQTNAVVDIPGQTVFIQTPTDTRFFQVRSDPQAFISRQEVVGAQLALHYEFQPQYLSLQSSASAQGPYADEGGAIIESADRLLKISRMGQARFFRIRSDQPVRIASIAITNGNVVIHYQ